MQRKTRTRAHNARPLKTSLYDAIVNLPPEVAKLIEDLRTEHQREWKGAVISHLTRSQGIPQDIARYAAEHSLLVETAEAKAIKINEILKEIQGY